MGTRTTDNNRKGCSGKLVVLFDFPSIVSIPRNVINETLSDGLS